MAIPQRINELNDRFKNSKIQIINGHTREGEKCQFIEMVESDVTPDKLLMKVQAPDGNHVLLESSNVFLITKK